MISLFPENGIRNAYLLFEKRDKQDRKKEII